MRPNLDLLRSSIGPMLTEAGKLERPTGGWVYDPETGTEVQARELIYAGPMLVRPEGAQPSIVDVGATAWPRTPYEVTLPAETDVKIGDFVTLTSCDYDPQLVGVEITLTDAPLDARSP